MKFFTTPTLVYFKKMKTSPPSLLIWGVFALSLIWKTSCLWTSLCKDVVKTSSGPVLGTKECYNGRIVRRYLGIPYAEPPVRNLRFRKPQPVKPWSKILLANKKPPSCTQYTEYPFPWYDSESAESEDCLYLNIWVPETPAINTGKNKADKTVIFWLHGGSFSVGSSGIAIYESHVLAAEGDVIMVTLNFRLNALAFFTTDTKSAPGNVGLYDILEALKWVNKNIAAFGGDPNRVTIAGVSSGAKSVGLLCLSPLAKGLFTRAILQSGSSLFAVNKEVNVERSQKLAVALGCADEDSITIFNNPEEVLECVRCRNATEIAKTLFYMHPTQMSIFTPNYGDEFLPTYPENSLRAGDFHSPEVLIGADRDEGSFLITTSNPNTFGVFGKKYPVVDKSYGRYLIKQSLSDFPHINAVIGHYLGNLPEDDYREIRKQVYTASGDFNMLCLIVYFAELLGQAKKNVYFYFFVHRPSITPWAKWMGVVHFDEAAFVFGYPLRRPDLYSTAEIQLSKNMIEIWSNFAKYGNPGNISWPLYSRENPTYVNLNTDLRTTYGKGPHKNNCDFFRNFYGFD